MLRRILGPVCLEGQWRSRYNDELYEMYADLTVVQRIKLARFRWAGHVVHMETDDPARKVFLESLFRLSTRTEEAWKAQIEEARWRGGVRH